MTDINSDVGPKEVKAAVDALEQSFDAFTRANDMATEQKSADPIDQERLARLDQEVARLSRHLSALGRPSLGATEDPADEVKSAFFDGYIRRGNSQGLTALQTKSLSAGVDSEGGYAVPEALDQSIERRLREISPIRTIANVVQIGSGDYKKLVTTSGAVSGWVGETDPRSETTAPVFGEVVPPLGELYANPAATQTLLDDSFFDVEAWLAEELADEFASKEGAAFVTGNGVSKPRGFLDQPQSAADDDTRPFGTLQTIATGIAGGFPATSAGDILIDLVHSINAGYRGEAAFVMNSQTLAAVRKLKDADGNYLWRPGLEAGQPGALLGYPVIEAAHMPDIDNGATAIAFGNFRRGYCITDRYGVRVLRDPYSNKPFVHFYTTKRTGGAVINSDAIKLLKFAVA